MSGKENHLEKVQGVSDYQVPAKDSARLLDPLKKKPKKSKNSKKPKKSKKSNNSKKPKKSKKSK